jgi:hypothetical protein
VVEKCAPAWHCLLRSVFAFRLDVSVIALLPGQARLDYDTRGTGAPMRCRATLRPRPSPHLGRLSDRLGPRPASRRSSSSASATSIDGSGPPRSTSRTAKSRHQSQLGVDGLDVTHPRSLGPRDRVTRLVQVSRIPLPGVPTAAALSPEDRTPCKLIDWRHSCVEATPLHFLVSAASCFSKPADLHSTQKLE